ncbi:hypothetical protein MIR68_000373 [Amoeboaphelidium protococcarum]|nr:hypothetical protein MIR68_000373 [Amoeboaphelidium protococcarum]
MQNPVKSGPLRELLLGHTSIFNYTTASSTVPWQFHPALQRIRYSPRLQHGDQNLSLFILTFLPPMAEIGAVDDQGTYDSALIFALISTDRAVSLLFRQTRNMTCWELQVGSVQQSHQNTSFCH